MSQMIITLSNKQCIEIELWDSIAPKAIEGMKKLSAKGKYNHHRIERLEPGFVIQPLFFDGVDLDIDQMVELEALNQNTEAYFFDSYVVGMAGDGRLSSATQFFICMSRQKRLDGLFTIVGKVSKGMDVCDSLNLTEVSACKDENGYTYHAPKKDIMIESIVIR